MCLPIIVPPPPTSHPDIIVLVPVFDIDTCNVGWEVLYLTNKEA